MTSARNSYTDHKIRKSAVFVTAIGLAFTASSAIAQDLPEILTDEAVQQDVYLPDFSYAGYGFGVEDIPTVTGTVLDPTEFGARPDDGIDDTKAVQDTLARARETDGSVIIKFPAGRFILTEVLEINRSDIVIRGNGRGKNGTTLYFPRPLKLVGDNGRLDALRAYLLDNDKRQREPKKNLDMLFSEYSWAGGFFWVGRSGSHGQESALSRFDSLPSSRVFATSGVRGELQVTVADVKELEPGQHIHVNWRNDKGEDGPLLREMYGETDMHIGSRHWDTPNRPLVAQRTIVESIDGNVVTLGDPLLHNITAEIAADIVTEAPLTQIGIEDLRFEFPNAANYGHHTEEGYNAIYFTGAAHSWARNLIVKNSDSGIIVNDSANVTLRDIRTEGERTAHYSVQIGSSHNILAERIQVFNPTIHALSLNTLATRSVFKDSEVFVAPSLDQHAGANHQNLYDNVTLHFSAERHDDKPAYKVFDGSGARYWQPGHGRYNTTWNLTLIVEDGAAPDETVVVQGLDEGPAARIIGIHGNRNFELDYRPAPYASHINEPVSAAPSLYDYQRQQRLNGAQK